LHLQQLEEERALPPSELKSIWLLLASGVMKSPGMAVN
jgi:hypothetical protein